MEKKDVVYFVKSCDASEANQNCVFSICVGEWHNDSELRSICVIDLDEEEVHIKSPQNWKKVEMCEVPLENAVKLINLFCSELKSMCFRCEDGFFDDGWENYLAHFGLIHEFGMEYLNYVLPSLNDKQIFECYKQINDIYFQGYYIGGLKEICETGEVSKEELEDAPDLAFIQQYRFFIGYFMEKLEEKCLCKTSND